MGVGYSLVNHTKREVVGYLHVPASKARELAGHPAAAAITTWYLIENKGDDISFVSDTHDDWPFAEGSREDLKSYADATEKVIEELIEVGILEDRGKSFEDPEKPDSVFERDLQNVWVTNDPC